MIVGIDTYLPGARRGRRSTLSANDQNDAIDPDCVKTTLNDMILL